MTGGRGARQRQGEVDVGDTACFNQHSSGGGAHDSTTQAAHAAVLLHRMAVLSTKCVCK
jgi:hypothetical protein